MISHEQLLRFTNFLSFSYGFDNMYQELENETQIPLIHKGVSEQDIYHQVISLTEHSAIQ